MNPLLVSINAAFDWQLIRLRQQLARMSHRPIQSRDEAFFFSSDHKRQHAREYMAQTRVSVHENRVANQAPRRYIPRQPMQHGTLTCYVKGKCRCGACRETHATYQAAHRAALQVRP